MTQKKSTLTDSSELASYRATVGRLAVLRPQKAQLENLLATTDAAITEARGKVPDLSHFTARRVELLTDVALGVAQQLDLEILDREIAERQQERSTLVAASRQTIADAEQTALGLRRRLDACLQEIDAEAKKEGPLLQKVLFRHAEDLGEAYAAAALALKDALFALVGVDNLIQKHGGKRRLYGYVSVNGFTIPSFYLDSCRALEHPYCPGDIFRASHGFVENSEQATEEQKLALQNQGVSGI
jgi:GAF domain-containing protein